MIGWLVDTALVTAALIGLVLVLRRPFARLFGPGAAYALWALPMVRLLMPPLVLPAGWAQPEPDAAGQPPVLDIVLNAPADGASSAYGPAVVTVLAALWLSGAVFYLAWQVWNYRAMRRRVLAGARPVGEAEAGRGSRQSARVRLVESPLLTAPVAFGVIDKVVAMPMGFMAQPDRSRRDLAIAHELEHHAGHDLAAIIAAQPLLALHWCNPLAWAGWQAMRRDQEAACDARVMIGRDAPTRAAYGGIIADFAARCSGDTRLALAAPMAAPLHSGPVFGEKSIIHRLRSLTMSEPSSHRRQTGRVLLAAALLATPLTATISHATPESPAQTPPTDGTAPRTERRIVMIEREGPDGGESSSGEQRSYTRTITRDGKTVVLTTSHPLTDAEFEAAWPGSRPTSRCRRCRHFRQRQALERQALGRRYRLRRPHHRLPRLAVSGSSSE